MKESAKTSFAERLKTAADAKQALLDKLRPKSAVKDPLHDQRPDIRAAELKSIRDDRAAAKQAKLQATIDARDAEIAAALAAEAAGLDAKRGERKERKALSKAEAQVKRDARYAARKARR